MFRPGPATDTEIVAFYVALVGWIPALFVSLPVGLIWFGLVALAVAWFMHKAFRGELWNA